jgi:hypothetical protein
MGGRLSDEPKGRRRTTNLSSDGEKSSRKRSEGKEESPSVAFGLTQPSAVVEAAPQETAEPQNARPASGPERSSERETSPLAANLNDHAALGTATARSEPTDMMTRIRAYAASGASPEEAAAEAPKTASGKSRRQ